MNGRVPSGARRHAGGIAAITASVARPEVTVKRSVFRRNPVLRAHRLHIRAPTATSHDAETRSVHDVREMHLGRLHATRHQGIHCGVPHSPRADPGSALHRLSGATRQPAGAGDPPLPTLRPVPRRLNACGTGVAPGVAVQPEANGGPDDKPQQVIIYRFSVNRGMAIALVIETPDWYAGLLQAALARVRIEGLN